MKVTMRTLPLLVGALAFGQASAGTLDLSTAGWVQYGDALSYSLPLNGFEVMSGPGQIDLFTKVGLGANGQLGNGTAGMDNAFDTPQANNVNGFRMTASNEASGTGSWDRTGWWDASIGALAGALNGNLPVFFFANNETGSGGKLLEGSDASLAVWGRIEVTDLAGNLLKDLNGNVISRFDLTNHANNSGAPVGYGPPPIGGGALFGNPQNYTSTGAAPGVADFLMSGGEVCLDASNAVVSCASNAVVKRVQHNLGGDRAAYAVVVPELNALLAQLMTSGADLDNYAFHMDVRLGCGAEGSFPGTTANNGNFECSGAYALNGGDEKIFIGTMDMIQKVPEPGSLLLVAGALLGLGLSSKRKRD